MEDFVFFTIVNIMFFEPEIWMAFEYLKYKSLNKGNL